MENYKAVIFTGGKGPVRSRIEKTVSEAGLIVAADSGWDLAADMGITPDIYIGDLDSVNDHKSLSMLSDEKKLIYPEDKDFTDTELAINYVKDKKYRDIVLVGGGGGRIDHTMALIGIFCRDYKPVEWYTDTEKIIYADSDCEIDCEPETTVSVFDAGEYDTVITSEGLKWELSNFRLSVGKFSISNRSVGSGVKFRIHNGSVLIIVNY